MIFDFLVQFTDDSIHGMILLLIFQKHRCDIFHVFNTSLLLDILKCFVDGLHGLLIVFDDFDFLLVAANSMSESEFYERVNVNYLSLRLSYVMMLHHASGVTYMEA